MSLIREKMLKLVSFLFRQAIPSRRIGLASLGDIYILFIIYSIMNYSNPWIIIHKASENRIINLKKKVFFVQTNILNVNLVCTFYMELNTLAWVFLKFLHHIWLVIYKLKMQKLHLMSKTFEIEKCSKLINQVREGF